MSTAQPEKAQFHYFFSPFAKYQMSAILPDRRKVVVHFVENRFMTNDEELVAAMRRNPRFSVDFNETTRLVPSVPVSSVVVDTSALPIDGDLAQEAVRRAAELEGAGAPKSESGAVDMGLTRVQSIRNSLKFNKPGDPVPGPHNEERGGAMIGTTKVIEAKK